LERQVGVEDSVSDVDSSEAAGVSSGEGQEARPSETTHYGHSLSSVALDAPLVGVVDGVEEVVDEHISLEILLLFFVFVLQASEHGVAAEVKILVKFEPVESLVSLNFSKSVFLVRALRDNLAAVFNAVLHNPS